MRRQDFFYSIPDELIAQSPTLKRSQSRLLTCHAENRSIDDFEFEQLPDVIRRTFPSEKFPHILMIINDSRVYPARVRIKRKTGARGEVFLLETNPKKISLSCLLRPLSKLKLNEVLYSDEENGVPLFEVTQLSPPKVKILDPWTLEQLLDEKGEMPLPPYISRDPQKQKDKKFNLIDKERYQTVYSKLENLGSSAAPTAGLHFTETIMSQCEQAGIQFAAVTLHVGLGTFQPVQENHIDNHMMHKELYCVNQSTFEKIWLFLKNEWPIIFVGTTSFRTIESFFRTEFHPQTKLQPENLTTNSFDNLKNRAGTWLETNLFYYPENKEDKKRPLVGNGILTNFHQPESTLVMLVSALMGYSFWQEFYSHAIAKKYRFFSYGDSSLLIF